jgi:hypothetical protein
MPRIVPASDDAKTILETASDYTGWNVDSMLDVICDYLNANHGTDEFLRHVQEAVDEECEETDND